MLDFNLPHLTGTAAELSAFGAAATGNVLRIVEGRTARIAVCGTLLIVAGWLTFRAYMELRGAAAVVKHDVVHRGGPPAPAAPAAYM